jgi:uncharacterized protein YbaR (Trm112 family)
MSITTLPCPVCQQPMTLCKQDTSHTKDQTKHYDRHFFTCHQDDIWYRVEIPQTENRKVETL